MAEYKKLKSILMFLGAQVLPVVIVMFLVGASQRKLFFAFVSTLVVGVIIHELGHGCFLSMNHVPWSLKCGGWYWAIAWDQDQVENILPWAMVFLSLTGVLAQGVFAGGLTLLHMVHILSERSWIFLMQTNAMLAIVNFIPGMGSDGSNFWSRLAFFREELSTWQKIFLVTTYFLLVGISIYGSAFGIIKGLIRLQ